jgi:hypothetical protein
MRTHLLLGALVLATVSFVLPQARAAGPKSDASKPSIPDNQVNITGGLSGSEVMTGNSVLFWVTIENDSSSSLDKLTVRLDVAGDEFVVTCFSGVLGAFGAKQSICGPFSDPLLKKQAITVRGEVRSLKTTEPRNINAIVSFDSSLPEGAAVSSVRAISLGPLISRSWLLQFLQNYKELVLPLVVLIAGWYLTRKQENVQTRRAQVAETWNSMLPISHELTMRYYMPMAKALIRLSEDAQKFTIAAGSSLPQPTEEGLSVYFHTMQFWWRYRRTLEEKGAIYFKNRTGEKLIIAAFDEFRKKYKGEGLGRFEIERRVKAVNSVFIPELEFPEFWTAYNATPRAALAVPFDSGWKDFVFWYSDAEKRARSFAMLEVFRLILEFEANRPYQKWYNSQQPLEITEEQKKILKALAKSDAERREFEGYLKAAVKGRPD